MFWIGALLTVSTEAGADNVTPPPVPHLQIVGVNFGEARLRPDLTANGEVEIQWSQAKPTSPPQFYLRMNHGGVPCKAAVTNLITALPFTDQNTTAKIPIEVTACSGDSSTGFLGIANSPEPNEVTVHFKRFDPRWPTLALYGSLALALVIALLCTITVIRHGHRLRDTIGGGSWDFSSSWASNVTAFGAAISLLIQASFFPDKPIFGARVDYSFLAFFAGALVALAPLVQRLMGKTDVANPPTANNTSTSYGLVGGFLAASLFTMWGAYLQLCVALLILTELLKTRTITEPMAIPVGATVLLVGIGLAVYCWWKILATIAANASRTGKVTIAQSSAILCSRLRH
jgi:hypothetical protein